MLSAKPEAFELDRIADKVFGLSPRSDFEFVDPVKQPVATYSTDGQIRAQWSSSSGEIILRNGGQLPENLVSARFKSG